MCLLEVELHPLERFFEIWTPGICECDLIWTWSLCRSDWVKMVSLGWILIQCDHCPCEKRKTPNEDRDTQGWQRQGGQRLSDAATSRGIDCHPQKLEWGKEGFYPDSQRKWSCWYLDFGLLDSRGMNDLMCGVLSHLVCGNFLPQTATGNEHSRFK